VTSDQRSVVPDHRLFPHERWFAAFILERQQSHRTPAILRMEQNYGPEGIGLMAAGLVTALPGQLIGCLGILLLLVSGGHGSLPGVGYLLMGLGVLLVVPGSLRYIQGSRAGRSFRGDRPFVKRP
jgi:hypothetical protein